MKRAVMIPEETVEAMVEPGQPFGPKCSAVPSIRPRTRVDSCPTCSKTAFSTFEDDCSQGVNLTYQICRHCGLVFMSPRFSTTDLKTFYQAEYRLMYSGDTKPTAANLDEQKARAEHLSTLIKRQVESLESHLDIGCSAGELLLGVRSKYQQVESAGIELSEAHREWCWEQGLRVYPTIDEMRANMEGRFQLISLSHVLEHLPDPVAFLEMLRAEVLLPDGYILIEVPNLFGHVSVEMAHLICFSEKTLKDTLHKAGYQILSTKIHSVPRNYERGRRYITVIATPVSAEEMRPERIRYVWWRWVKLQRLKGLSGRSWTQLALHSPRIMTSLITRAINGKA